MGEFHLQESTQPGKPQQFLLQQLLSGFCTQVKNSLQFLLHKCLRYRGPVPAVTGAQVPGEHFFPSTFSKSRTWEGTDKTIPKPDMSYEHSKGLSMDLKNRSI